MLRAEIEAVLNEGLSSGEAGPAGTATLENQAESTLLFLPGKAGIVALVALLFVQAILYLLFATGADSRRLYTLLDIGSLAPGPN